MYKSFVLVLTVVSVFALWSSVAQAQSPGIRIVKPVDRHNVPLGQVPVEVEITGVTPNDGSYWELYSDTSEVVTIRDGSTTGTLNFTQTGPHTIEATLFDRNGKPVASQNILVIAAPVSPVTPLFNRPMMAQFMAVFVVVVIGIIALGLRMRPRVSS